MTNKIDGRETTEDGPAFSLVPLVKEKQQFTRSKYNKRERTLKTHDPHIHPLYLTHLEISQTEYIN